MSSKRITPRSGHRGKSVQKSKGKRWNEERVGQTGRFRFGKQNAPKEKFELEDEEIDSDEADGFQKEEEDESEGELSHFLLEDEGSDQSKEEEEEGGVNENGAEIQEDLVDPQRDETLEKQRENLKKMEEEDEEDEALMSGEEDKENAMDDEKLQRLQAMINQMHQSDLSKKKGNKMALKTEIVPESQFNLRATDKITLDDLMASIKDEAGFSEVKKQLSVAQKVKTRDELSEPLSDPAKARIERAAAYGESKKELSKWSSFVTHLNKQEHVQFPLYAPKQEVTSASLAVRFEPEMDFEREIDTILRENGMHEDNLKQTEELALKEVSEDEVKRRRNELIKMRNLLFYQELKAKRQKKIKSKTYHKILKRQKERQKLSLEELQEVNPEAAKLEEERRERQRALERITQRHSKSKSKFSRTANIKNEKTRDAINEQLRLREDLKRKIDTVYSDEEGEEDENQNVSEEKYEKFKSEEELPELPKKGLFSMKFIQKSIIGQKVDVETDNQERPPTLAEVLMQGKSSTSIQTQDSSHENSKPTEFLGSTTVVEQVGMSSGFKVKATKPLAIDVDKKLLVRIDKKDTPSNSKLNQSPLPLTSPNKKQKLNAPSNPKSSTSQQSNVLLDTQTIPEQWTVEKPNGLTLEKSEGDEKDSSENKKKRNSSEKEDGFISLQKETKKQKLEQTPETEDNPWLFPAEDSRASKKLYTPEKKKIELNLQDTIELDQTKSKKSKKQSFDLLGDATAEQRALIQEAFASDDAVVTEFQEEKEALANQTEKKQDGGILPGWGSWTGEGVKESAKKNKLKLETPATTDKSESRKDAKLKNVIINEKRLKKTVKYMVDKVPHPFTNREQYERMQRQVIGKDWNPVKIFDELTKPSVLVKPGTSIQPITTSSAKTYLFSKTDYEKEEKKKRKKKQLKKVAQKKKEAKKTAK